MIKVTDTFTVVLGEYLYNGNGQRVKKTVEGKTTYFIYDQSGNLIQETDENGEVISDYIYLGNLPIARIDEWFEGMKAPQPPTGVTVTPGDQQLTVQWNENVGPVDGYKVYWGTEPRKYTNSMDVGMATSYTITGLTNGTPYYVAVTAYKNYEEIYYYHTDHLGTPIMMTDKDQNVVWEGEFMPFGEAYSITGTITNNLRFPGQYFDEETGLHYNYFRDYNPVIGRYIQFDPLGLKGGLNLYVYANNNTLARVDLCGLANANTYTYGEIRGWAVKCSPSDLSSPAGLADAKASIGAACSKGNACSSVDGSTETAPADQAAWKNIVNAAGGVDRSGGGNYMCTKFGCYITECYKCCGGEKTRVRREQPLTTITGSVTVSSCRGGTVYFYNDPYKGWCSREDYLNGCR